MNILSSRKWIAAVSMSCCAAGAASQEAGSAWRLRVTDMQRQLKVEATIRFTDEPAQSCMGGTWKRIAVEGSTAKAEAFFPLSAPLAYRQEDKTLTFGRTQVCDGYLFMSGPAGKPAIQGSYDAVGFGSTQRGWFTLEKVR